MPGWVIENQATPYSDAVSALLQEDRAWVPALWELEFTNVLRGACLKQKLQAVQAQDLLAEIASLPLDVDRRAVPPGELLSLALRFGLRTYDAAYLELALRLQLPVATQDAALREAALACGVGLLRAT